MSSNNLASPKILVTSFKDEDDTDNCQNSNKLTASKPLLSRNKSLTSKQMVVRVRQLVEAFNQLQDNEEKKNATATTPTYNYVSLRQECKQLKEKVALLSSENSMLRSQLDDNNNKTENKDDTISNNHTDGNINNTSNGEIDLLKKQLDELQASNKQLKEENNKLKQSSNIDDNSNESERGDNKEQTNRKDYNNGDKEADEEEEDDGEVESEALQEEMEVLVHLAESLKSQLVAEQAKTKRLNQLLEETSVASIQIESLSVVYNTDATSTSGTKKQDSTSDSSHSDGTMEEVQAQLDSEATTISELTAKLSAMENQEQLISDLKQSVLALEKYRKKYRKLKMAKRTASKEAVQSV